MMRLVYALSRFVGIIKKAIFATVKNSFRLTTYHPHISAALLLLLPQLLKGQCTTLLCNQNVEVKLDDNCLGTANPYYMISNNWSCQGPMTMTYYNAAGNVIGNTVNIDHIGQTLNVHVKHNWTGLTCWGTIQVVDKKAPKIVTQNVTLNCTEDPSVAALGEPDVSDNCSNQITLSHQDTVIDFGCGYTGFAGYFTPDNWTTCLTNTGDGGVDVTGAPGQVLVEGANNSPQGGCQSKVTRFKIEVPTSGYISFDWSSFGGSNFSCDEFFLTINNWCVQLSNDTTNFGSYTTGLLNPGDILSFEVVSDGGADALSVLISQFHFHTQAWKVFHRKWTATDQWGNTSTKTQVITLNRAQLSQVVFPPNHDGVQAPMLPCGATATSPAATGLPFIDQDGNPTTTADQFAVDNGDCFFQLSHEDDVIQTCEGSELILRKWTVSDDCSGDILEHTQLIKIFDTTPPALICPPPTVLSTDDFGCFGNINLPAATATDDCSSSINIEPYWQFGAGFGPFGNIAQGAYTVTYQATDACGNTATCNTLVTIEDQVPPTVICDEQTVASLTEDGTALVFANSVDDGSYDMCCIASYEIKRTDQGDNFYASQLFIECADLTTPVMVRLKVTDCNGNNNFCDVEVIVQDAHPPTIVAPADVTVDCNTSLGDLSQFGEPVVSDNCTFALTSTSEQTATNCGQGNVTRFWTATDLSGNVATAQQIIHLTNQAPWNGGGNAITWPPDYQISGCGISLEPFDLPAPFSGPQLANQTGCEAVNVNWEDEVFWIAEPSCYKVFRTWKITDQCQYQPGGTAGYWEHVQIIEVLDNEPPVFDAASSDIVVTMTGNGVGCAGNVVLPFPLVTDCSDHIIITATGDLGSGFNFQNVQTGVYQMTYTASDGCGNQGQKPFTVTVGDPQSPTAGCLNGLTVTLGPNGQTTVNAQAFNLGSTDNCTPFSALQFAFSDNPGDNALTVNCDDVGQMPVQLFVFDQGGNSATCESFLLVVDNPDACGQPAPTVSIGGWVQTPNGQPVAQTSLLLSGPVAMPEMTPASGAFSFDNLPMGEDFTLSPTKNIYPQNGVTALDLLKINDHILGVHPFTAYWQFIAADANSSGAVTAADLAAIQSVILFISPNFPNSTPSWKFVPANYTFPDPANPFPFPQLMSMNNLASDYLDANFIGIKTGDVTGNANPAEFSGEGATDDRSSETLLFRIDDRTLAHGETAFVEVRPGESAAWQWTLDFDPQLIEIQEVEKQEKSTGGVLFGQSHLPEGALTALWQGKGSPVFTMKIVAKKALKLSETLHFSSRYTQALAWDEAGSNLKIEAAFFDHKPLVETPKLLQNQPNPFSEKTAIRFYLPEAGQAQFLFFDAAGKVLLRQSGVFEKGYNELIVNGKDLAVTGLVFYKMLVDGAFVGNGRMVLVE